MTLKIKRLHPDAVLPSYAKDGDSGLDLHALEDVVLLPGVPTLVSTGIAVELPEPRKLFLPNYLMKDQTKPEKLQYSQHDYIPGERLEIIFEAQIRPRSGLALKHGITCHFGTVDNGYRGEIGVILRWDGHAPNIWAFKTDGEEIRPAKGGYQIRKGDRIAQMVVALVVRCNVVEAELSESERGSSGFGSTGK